jgi:hypothetical protein
MLPQTPMLAAPPERESKTASATQTTKGDSTNRIGAKKKVTNGMIKMPNTAEGR